MPRIEPGTRFGPYEIRQWLGAGGMGDVYRARDPRLGRDVAIKLIAAAVSADPSRVRRFEQEARAAASIAHPHILVVYDIGVQESIPFIVSELLEGESLRRRLDAGALPSRKALPVARAIADGLAAAHDKGIVHRDIKPDNIFLTTDGRVKILDFGIAKLTADERDAPAAAATETSAGVVVGTARYMSPEQVRGEPVDGRSDIFSLGAVLHEMIVGSAPFTRDSAAETMAAILKAEPPEIDPALAPLPVARVVSRCLEKDRESRFQSARDLAFSIDVIGGTGVAAPPPPSMPTRRWRFGVGLGLAGVAGAIAGFAALAAVTYERGGAIPFDPLAEATFSRFTDWPGAESAAEISPDGRFVAFASDKAGESDVWISQIGTGTFRNVTADIPPLLPPVRVLRGLGFAGDGTELWGSLDAAAPSRLYLMPFGGGARRPFLGIGDVTPAWSPDGKRLAFVNGRAGDPIFVAGPMGVDPQPLLKDAPGMHNHNPAWSADGAWLYFVHGPDPAAGMDVWRIRADGGGREQLTQLGTDVSSLAPLDERTLLYVARAPDQSGPWLWTLDVPTRHSRRVTSGLDHFTSVSASRDGTRIVATIANPSTSLFVVPLSNHPADERDVRPYPGELSGAQAPRFGGSALYFLNTRTDASGLWRTDQGGTPSQVWKGTDGPLAEPAAVSRDGSRIVIVLRDGGRRRLVSIAADGTSVRTLAPSLELLGTPGQAVADWSPDGQWLAVGGADTQGPGLFKVGADGSHPVRLTAGIANNPVWSPAGDMIVYSQELVEGRARLSAVHPDGTPQPLPDVRVRPGSYRFTPDGRRVVFISTVGGVNFSALDIASGGVEAVTTMSNRGAIATFDVTPDGTQLVFDRTLENSDIVLIEVPKRAAPGVR
jgi:Tol biopolymer transport system component